MLWTGTFSNAKVYVIYVYTHDNWWLFDLNVEARRLSFVLYTFTQPHIQCDTLCDKYLREIWLTVLLGSVLVV